jgi:hypothetical protein
MFALRSTPRVEVRGATVTSDARLLLRRELSERLGLSARNQLRGRDCQFPLLACSGSPFTVAGPARRTLRQRLSDGGRRFLSNHR